MMEALEDFYMIGFSTMDKEQDWDGKLVTEETLNISSDSYVICFDGQPTINDQVFTRFDYAEVSSNKEYEISLNDGVLALLLKNEKFNFMSWITKIRHNHTMEITITR